ncbi:MAG: hypothetical protein RLY86_927 [Pseudomonadota bacterium]
MNRIVRLVIEDAEAVALAEELASRAGLSVEEAVKDLLRREIPLTLEQAPPPDDGIVSGAGFARVDTVAAVQAISRRFRDLVPDPGPSTDMDFLYDETGAPR